MEAIPPARFMDSAGNFYGEASQGGPSGDGVVFELPKWSSTITDLVSFDRSNGAEPDLQAW